MTTHSIASSGNPGRRAGGVRPNGSVRFAGESHTYSAKFTPASYPIGSLLMNLPSGAW